MYALMIFNESSMNEQTKKNEIIAKIHEAQQSQIGIWSLGANRVTAAEQKRLLHAQN
jgi:hypothetical protein